MFIKNLYFSIYVPNILEKRISNTLLSINENLVLSYSKKCTHINIDYLISDFPIEFLRINTNNNNTN